MTKNSARRLSLSLLLGASLLGASSFAIAQTSTPPSTNGVTGTDPCPKNMICAAGSNTSASTPAVTNGSTAEAVAQTLLVLLGLA